MANVVEINQADLIAIEMTINRIKGGSKLAIVRATNDMLTGVRTESVRVINNKINLKQAIIRKHFLINKMRLDSMSAHVDCAGKPVPLINFTARQVNKGITVKVLRAGKRDTVRHAFIAKMSSGHIGVYWRTENIRGTRWKVGRRMKLPSTQRGDFLRKYQLPIHELYGPAVPAVFDDPEIMSPVLDNASVRLSTRLEHHTQRLMQQAA
jgi:hypothetical protein